MKRSYPEYPLFLIKTPEQHLYWVPAQFAEMEFLGTITKYEDMENLLELSIDDKNNVYVGGEIKNGILLGGVYIGTIYKKGEFYWHHVFCPEKRKTVSSAARALYKKIRLHRTSIGPKVIADFQAKRNF